MSFIRSRLRGQKKPADKASESVQTPPNLDLLMDDEPLPESLGPHLQPETEGPRASSSSSPSATSPVRPALNDSGMSFGPTLAPSVAGSTASSSGTTAHTHSQMAASPSTIFERSVDAAASNRKRSLSLNREAVAANAGLTRPSDEMVPSVLDASLSTLNDTSVDLDQVEVVRMAKSPSFIQNQIPSLPNPWASETSPPSSVVHEVGDASVSLRVPSISAGGDDTRKLGSPQARHSHEDEEFHDPRSLHFVSYRDLVDAEAVSTLAAMDSLYKEPEQPSPSLPNAAPPSVMSSPYASSLDHAITSKPTASSTSSALPSMSATKPAYVRQPLSQAVASDPLLDSNPWA